MFKRTTILATSWLLTCVTAVSISFAQQKKARKRARATRSSMFRDRLRSFMADRSGL